MRMTKAHLDAEGGLPPQLRDAFNLLVAEYRSAAERHTGQPSANYAVLSDLIRAGWRKAEPPKA